MPDLRQLILSRRKPSGAVLPLESIGDLVIEHLLALTILVVVCFLAGLAARTVVAKRLDNRLEGNVLSKPPAYALLQTKIQSMLSSKDVEEMTPVVARFDDSWQIAFEIERIEDRAVVIFLTGAAENWQESFSTVASYTG